VRYLDVNAVAMVRDVALAPGGFVAASGRQGSAVN
jgi:hypothetical protein